MRPVVGTFLIVVGLGRPGAADCQRLAPLVSSTPSDGLLAPRAPSNVLLAPGALRWRSLVTDSQPRRAVPRTYWLEGGLIGAGALGLGVAVFAALFCSQETGGCTSDVLRGLGLGAVFGFIPGALIGGQIRKKGAQSSLSP
jgi:hypothetical protein